MFDDFSQSSVSGQSRKRFRNSMAAAVVIYGSSGAAIVGATTGLKHAVEENLTQVEFAPPPEPEPPPPEPEAPPPKPQTSPRPKMKRAAIKPPDEVPLEKPKESDAPLAAAGESGPVDGFLDGVEGGTGTARPAPPPPAPVKLEPLVPARESGNSPRPDFPKAAMRKGIEGTVVVAFDVLENGRVVNPQIISGPKEFHECVLKAAVTWRYKPATRGGKPVKSRAQKRVTFRLEDA